ESVPMAPPALFTSDRSGPVAAACSARRVTSAGSVRSAGKVAHPVSSARASSRSARRAVARTSQPSRRRRRTVAAPIPLEAPVTRARGVVSLVSVMPRSCLLAGRGCSLTPGVAARSPAVTPHPHAVTPSRARRWDSWAQAAPGGGSGPGRGAGARGGGRGCARPGQARSIPARRPWLLAHPWRCCSLPRRDTAPARRDTITGMKVGFLGAGNMAGAIVRGAVAGGAVAADDIAVTSAHGSARALAGETGVTALADNAELVRWTGRGGAVVVAVKPYLFAEVLEPLRAELAGAGSLVVSLAAGLTLARLESMLPDGQAVIRVMPNVNAMVGAGMAGVCGNDAVRQDPLDAVVPLFEAVGDATVLPVRLFPAYAAIAGSAPAWTAAYVEALARAAVKNGMPKQQAVTIAAQMMLGTARTLLERELAPADLMDMVSSPGGTTIAGTVALED